MSVVHHSFVITIINLYCIVSGLENSVFETTPKNVIQIISRDSDGKTFLQAESVFNKNIIKGRLRGKTLEDARLRVSVLSGEQSGNLTLLGKVAVTGDNVTVQHVFESHFTSENNYSTSADFNVTALIWYFLQNNRLHNWNLTLTFQQTDFEKRELNSIANLQISIIYLRLFTGETICEFDNGHCEKWSFHKNDISIDNHCTGKRCKWIPEKTSTMSKTGKYAFLRNNQRHGSITFTSPKIIGSGGKCRLDIIMAKTPRTYVTVNIVTGNVSRTLHQETLYREKNWASIPVLIGQLASVFQVTVCIQYTYVTAIEKLAFSGCHNTEDYRPNCTVDQFQCSTGKCIDRGKVCDLNADCLLGDDEDTDLCRQYEGIGRCDFQKDQCNWTSASNDGKQTCKFKRADISNEIQKANEPYCNPTKPKKEYGMYLDKRRCSDFEESCLISPKMFPFKPSGDCRIRFWYYLEQGGDVYLRICNITVCSLIDWNPDINTGPDWFRVSVPIPHRPFEYYVLIYVVQDEGIGIDKISFTPDCYKFEIPSVPSADDTTMMNTSLTMNTTLGAIMERGERINNGEDTEKPDLMLTVIGVVCGLVLGIATAVIIFSVFRRRKSMKRDEEYKTKLNPSASASTSILGDKNTFQVDISDVSSNDSDRQFLVPSNMAVSTISPYYEWIEESENMIRSIPRKKIKLVKMIGKGAFGEVYYGCLADLAQNDLPVAIKTLPSPCSEQTKSEFFFEAMTLSKFKHANIVRFIGISVDDRSLYLILELMEGGDLRSFIRDSRPRKANQPSYLTLQDLLKLGLDVARGCNYLEQNKFVHRDIAARNCLLTEKGPNRVAKIGDFGMARDIFRTNYYRKNGLTMVPVKWMPPEGFLDGVFTSKTDVWAFGVVLWELFTMGHVPYPGKSNADVMKFVTSEGRLEKPPLCPAEVYNIMRRCWSLLPENRPLFCVIVEDLHNVYKQEDLGSLITFEDLFEKSPTDEMVQSIRQEDTFSTTTYASDLRLSTPTTKLLGDENDG